MPSRPISPNPNPISSSSSILKTKAFFLAITISSSVLILFIICYFIFYLWISVVRRAKTIPFDSNPPLKLQRFSYRELKIATNSFNAGNTLGKGGSGTVFHGVLRDGKSVAVKKLNTSSFEAERVFQNELQILGGLRSPYVTTLLGYCVDTSTRILVYEYMPNRSLQESLFKNDNDLILNWDRRFSIILDVAKAISFLHLDCEPPVIHGDIKPSNVLLDSEYRSKISDFGLSRIKLEGEFGAEMFSQELSGNLTGGAPAKSNSEVDFAHALALQASSSKQSKIFNNSKSLNLNLVNQKGKEVSINVDNVEEDEICSSIDHSKELSINAIETAQWGKDWWWRQDGSGELCSKDYVKEWIGTQISASENPVWEEGKPNFPEKINLGNHNSTMLGRFEARNELGFEYSELGVLKTQTSEHRKIQEWWKEEHIDEISKKVKISSNHKFKLKKLKINFDKKRIDIVRRFNLKKRNKFSVNHENDFNLEEEFSFRRGTEKKQTNSGENEAWSGDLFSRELSSTTSMRGTLCYVAPEYGGFGYLMEKSDIYSFGVLMLVIISGRRPLHVLASPMKLEKANLVSWSRNLSQRGNILELVDERLVKDGFDKDQASLCINLAMCCIQKTPELRPDTDEIVKILNGEMELPILPFNFSPSPPSKMYSRSRRKLKGNAK